MEKILLTGGKLLDQSEGLVMAQKDILLEDGRIAAIDDHIDAPQGARVIDVTGRIVAPGFIDIHAHIFPGCPKLGIEADAIGVEKGVTTICDAGTAGPENIGEFIEKVIEPSRTRIFSEMHFSKKGLFITPEADDPAKYDLELAEEAYHKYKEYIVAIKARASNSTVGKLGIVPIRDAKSLSAKLGIPLYVHIGNPLPYIEEVLEVMQKGDMITHSFHGKINGLLENGRIKPETQAARDRGVLFDVGHGVASFNFNTARAAFSQGFVPDVISTDLHQAGDHGQDAGPWHLPPRLRGEGHRRPGQILRHEGPGQAESGVPGRHHRFPPGGRGVPVRRRRRQQPDRHHLHPPRLRHRRRRGADGAQINSRVTAVTERSKDR